VIPRAIRAQTFDLATGVPTGGRFWHRPPTRVALDSDGVRVDYGPSRSRFLRWDDPKLQFALLDFREASHNRPPWVRRPKRFEFRYRPELGTSAFAIPEEAFQAVSDAARSVGLIRGPSVVGGGIPAGTKVFHYARRPLRWWSRVKAP